MKAREAYVSVTVTAVQNVATRLLDLINTALGANRECPGACRELLLQSTNGNSASIFIGDYNVSNTNGYELPAGSSAPGTPRIYRAGETNSVPLGNLYIYSTAASQKLNVEACAY